MPAHKWTPKPSPKAKPKRDKPFRAFRIGKWMPKKEKNRVRKKAHELEQETQELGKKVEQLKDRTLRHDLAQNMATTSWALLNANEILEKSPAHAVEDIQNAQLHLNMVKATLARRKTGITIRLMEIPVIEFEKMTKTIMKTSVLDDISASFTSNLSFANRRKKIVIDKPIVSRLIMNLLNNANGAIPRRPWAHRATRGKKYEGISKEDWERREVHCSVNLRQSNLEIQIADTGVGMTEEQIQRFQKGENVRKDGIGLNNVRKIVKAHNGKIKLESQFGKGTTFTITIPV